MMEKQKKLFIITSVNPEEAYPVAAFDDPSIAREFLNRPLAISGKYEVTETTLNPSFSTDEALLVWFVVMKPNKKKPIRVIEVDTFEEECNALNGHSIKEEGMLFINVLAKDRKEAAQLGMQRMQELINNGKWERM